jgi:hypothetical protein
MIARLDYTRESVGCQEGVTSTARRQAAKTPQIVEVGIEEGHPEEFTRGVLSFFNYFRYPKPR